MQEPRDPEQPETGEAVAANVAQTPAVVHRCAYCHAPLNPVYYFCLVCATPYKDISAVLPRAIPLPLSEGERIRRRVPAVWTVFWSYLSVLLTLVIIMFAGGFREADIVSWMLLSSVALAVLTVFFELRYWRSLVTQLKRLGFDRREAWIGLLVGLPLMLLINYGYHSFLEGYFKSDSFSQSVREESISFLGASFLLAVLPAINEEIAFRGLIQHWLQTVLTPWRAILLASALFTVLHFSAVSWPYLFGMGILLGWLKWKTASLYPSMVVHFLHNFLVLAWFP